MTIRKQPDNPILLTFKHCLNYGILHQSNPRSGRRAGRDDHPQPHGRRLRALRVRFPIILSTADATRPSKLLQLLATFSLIILPLNSFTFLYLLSSKILIAANSLAALKPVRCGHSRRRICVSTSHSAIDPYAVELALASVFYESQRFPIQTFSNTNDVDSFAVCDSLEAGFAAAIGSIVAVAPNFFPPRPRRSAGFFFAREFPPEASEGLSSWRRNELCPLCV